MQENNELNVSDMIELISQELGSNDKSTIVKIEKTENAEVKMLSLTNGDWQTNEPWFVLDENGEINTLIPMKLVNKIVQNFKDTKEENFNLKLEKTIWQNIPIDFNDVWVVAMDEIKNRALKENKEYKIVNVDLEELISNIKKEHPNLFLNMKDLHVVAK